jgi:protease I
MAIISKFFGGKKKMERLSVLKIKPVPSKVEGYQKSNIKNFTFFAVVVIVLTGLVAICPGQRRPRGAPLKIIQLPQPRLKGSLSFEETVVKQRIVRQLSNQTINFEQIGQLAWAGQGMLELAPQTMPQMQGTLVERQIEPQVQGIYPISLFFASPSGVHAYNPNEHTLEQTFERDVRSVLATAVRNPEVVTAAGCVVVIAGPIRDPAGRPANIARRLSLLQAGQTAQGIQLQAAGLNLASIPVSDFDSRNIAKICNLPRALEALYIIAVGYPAEQTSTATGQQPSGAIQPTQSRAAPQKAIFIVAGEDFNDRELFETIRVLNAAGVQVVISSTRLGVIRGMMGGIAESGILLSQLRLDDFNAVVFIGGDGAREYFNNPNALNIARQAVDQGKVLAAISIAPTILANAGVLRDVRATGYTTERAALQQAGAIYTGNHVERDGLIITSTGPVAVVQFAAAIAEALAGR